MLITLDVFKFKAMFATGKHVEDAPAEEGEELFVPVAGADISVAPDDDEPLGESDSFGFRSTEA